MKVSTASIDSKILRNCLSVVLAIGALAVLTTGADAAELDPITMSRPTTEIVGHELATGAPIKKTTVEARIAADPETLTMDSGVVLLNDRVVEAANKACEVAAPFTHDDGACVHDAVKAAQPQVAAAIARARSNTATG